jgi:nucleotide-binding universal stress UspA family protein
MELHHRVVVALARTEGDLELLEYAQHIAKLSPEAVFQFVHVLDWPAADSDPASVVPHHQARADIAATVAKYFPCPDGDCHVLSGSLLDRLLEFAVEQRSDLVLVGHHRERSGRRSLARRLAMQAPCSLLMAPRGSLPSIRRILCAVDFSEHSALALSTATLIAQRAGLAECLALHVHSETPAAGRAPAAFERFTAPLELHGVRVRPIFEHAPSVAQSAVRVAQFERADLIVAGTRGESRASSVLLGSVSEQLLEDTSIPLLIVKQRGERISLLEALFDRDLSGRRPPRFA